MNPTAKTIALAFLSTFLYIAAANVHHIKFALWLFCLSVIVAGQTARRIAQ